MGGGIVMAQKKRKKFTAHAVMHLTNDSGLEIMFNSNLDRVTVRAIVGGEVKRPYEKSDIFFDEETMEAYFVVAGGLDDTSGEMQYVKFYLSDFIRVGR